jgi:glycosyltransferase involved in cell wall biosynthesis/tetratricopeptide (TPR) repeat protein
MTKKKLNPKPLLELVMIVKDSEQVIQPVLESCIPYINHYTILDTGSLDNTIKIIQSTFKDKIKGNIFQEPFVDFSTSRNRVLELAGDRCQYTLMLDDTYILQGGEKFIKKIKKTMKESYNVRIFDKQDQQIYYSTRVLSTLKKYRYQFRVHEIPKLDKIPYQLDDEDIFLLDDKSKTVQRSIHRYNKDIQNLLLDLKDKTDPLRSLYYLGLTYTITENFIEAEKYFEERIKISRIQDEYLYQSLYNLALIKYKLGRNSTDIQNLFINSLKIFPNRGEPLYQLAVLYYKNGNISEAHFLLEKTIYLQVPLKYNLEVDLSIYSIKIPYLFIETGMMLKKNINYLKMLDNLIEKNPKICLFENMKEMIQPSNTSNIIRFNNSKVIVFYTDFSKGIYNPQNLKNNFYVSGSEIMARNLAIELAKFSNEFKVFLFGNFKDDTNDFSGIYKNVNFIDNKEYKSWVRKYYIDYLIVSRFSTNIFYLPNIQNVWLWLHDVFPYFEFIQAHRTKFRDILVLCDWHSKQISKEFHVPLEKIKVTRNAINTDRFQNQIEKVNNRFIYSSSPDRGLSYLLSFFPKIVEKYPDATLEIFCNKELLSPSEICLISSKEYFHLHPRVSQDELALEYLKSDIWLYPTDFTETYCITALEAQAAGCLCVTLDIGSLSEIVGERGIVIKGDIKQEGTSDKLLNELFKVMDNPNIKESYISKAREWGLKQDYKSLALEWKEKMFN